MNATIEIDKLGRVVVPKKMREALHLRPGDRLEIECAGDKLLIERERSAKGLQSVNGWLVYDSGGSPVTAEEMREAVETTREERHERIVGRSFKS